MVSSIDTLATDTIASEEIDRISSLSCLTAHSASMQDLMAKLLQVAPTDASVVLGGETGTGKELVARLLHALHPKRNSGPYVVVDCSSISDTIAESELFGHTKGSYSGAYMERKGLFEEANTGTILLDELGDLPLSLQGKLLRVLENGETRRLGANNYANIDVRVVAATKKNLMEMVARGKFRDDLYYRLCVYPMTVPSLRDRREDIPDICKYFIERSIVSQMRVTPHAMELLCSYGWPGNVRQMRNVIRRFAVLFSTSADPVIDEKLLGEVLSEEADQSSALVENDLSLPYQERKRILVETFEHESLRRAIYRNIGNRRKIAEELGVSVRVLSNMLRRHSLTVNGFETNFPEEEG